MNTTDVSEFISAMLDHIQSSARDAASNAKWRLTAIDEARDGYDLLKRKLSREGIAEEYKARGVQIVFLLEGHFETLGSLLSENAPENDIQAALDSMADGIEILKVPS